MKNKKYGLLAIAAMVATMASTASATPLEDCATASAANSGNMTMIGAQGCYVTGDTGVVFSNFVVSVIGASSVTVGIAGDAYNATTGDLTLDFQWSLGVESVLDTADIEISYTVTGGTSGIDDVFQAEPDGPGGNVTVSELACSTPFAGVGTGTACPGITLGSYSSSSTGQSIADQASFTQGVVSPVYIKKDIELEDATMSEFTNSNMTFAPSTVPEPMTFSLIGAGLLGLGFMGRRLKR